MNFVPQVHLLSIETTGRQVSTDGILEITSGFFGQRKGLSLPLAPVLEEVRDTLMAFLTAETVGWLKGQEANTESTNYFGTPDGSLATRICQETALKAPYEDYGLRVYRMRFRGTREGGAERVDKDHLKRSRHCIEALETFPSFQEVFAAEATGPLPEEVPALGKGLFRSWLEDLRDCPVVIGESIFQTFGFLQKAFEVGEDAFLRPAIVPKPSPVFPFPYTEHYYDVFDSRMTSKLLGNSTFRLKDYGRRSKNREVRLMPSLPMNDTMLDLVYLTEMLLHEDVLRSAIETILD